MNLVLKYSNNTLIYILNFLFYFLIIVFPYEYMLIKLFFLIVIILFIFVNSFTGRLLYFDKRLFLWVFLYLLMGSIYISYGVLRNNPGALNFVYVHVLWVIIYFILFSQINIEMYNKFIKWLPVFLIIISILGILAFIKFNFIGDTHSFLGFETGIRMGFPFFYIKSASTVSFIYLYPFVLSLFFLDSFKYRYFGAFVLILGFIFALFTSRRALFFNILLVPVLTFLFIHFTNKVQQLHFFKRFKKIMLWIALLLVFFLIVNSYYKFIDISQLVKFTENAWSMEKKIGLDDSSIYRKRQFNSLMEGWSDFPIFGVGSGANASVVRSKTPGVYELTYIALLFHRGLFGFTIYLLQILYLNFLGIKFLKNYNSKYHKYLIASLVAFDLFMLANGTNPYLDAFDHLWILFILITLLNLISREQKYGCKT